MKIKDIIKHTIERVMEDSVKDYKSKERTDFTRGALFGMYIVIDSLKDDLLCFEDSCLEDESKIADFGLDFDVEREII